MTPHRILAAAVGVLAVVGAQLPASAARAEDEGRPSVGWHACPEYSDDVLDWIGVPKEEFRAIWARTECGTVSVPLNHDDPRGERIDIAITRIKATDREHRIGSLAVNPGGPGGSGYFMPADLILSNALGEGLNEKYDLIGFDPRGVGYSTSVDCELDDPGPDPGTVTEEEARAVYDQTVAVNAACSSSNPEFLGELTTASVAHDLDDVRAALGERRLAFLGVSWGTSLGAVYRSLYPRNVSRMWLDSVAITEHRQDEFVSGRSAATAANFERMAAWVAGHDGEYGFGTTAGEVIANVAELRRAHDESPRTFDDIEPVIDGRLVAQAASATSGDWALSATVLAELRDATGPNAPPTIKRLLGGEGEEPPPPAGAPSGGNRTMNRAVFCNEDTGPRDFASAWEAYQERLETEPVTGAASRFTPMCAGWTLEPQTVELRYSRGSLVLSGHLYETPSPYQWTEDMRDAIGGTVVTVADDVHGSALMTDDCTSAITRYFATGRVGDTCEGVPQPSGA